jgi:hypothetical protein
MVTGSSLKEIAPAIYKLAWQKSYTVAQGLEAGRWKQGMQRITTREELTQYITLWTMIGQVQRTDMPNKITWKFNANGRFSTSSAYRVQFIGSYADHDWSKLWQAKVENKCKFHLWILLQNRLWTADRINRHGGQMDVICQLCKTHPESVIHMVAHCSFTKQLWMELALWLGITPTLPSQQNTCRSIKEWWSNTIQNGTGDAKERQQKLIYTIWNVGKERCRRLYENRAMT